MMDTQYLIQLAVPGRWRPCYVEMRGETPHLTQDKALASRYPSKDQARRAAEALPGKPPCRIVREAS